MGAHDMLLPVDTFVAPVCEDEIDILFQDESLLLINKPSGLLSLSGKNPANKDSVHYRLVQDFPSALMLHRLDFGTSGILIIGLTKTVAANINKQFQARSVHKTYHAILMGHLTHDSGVIDLPIAKDPMMFPKLKICHEAGKQAVTRYQVIDRCAEPASTTVCYTPETGRTHQLRIHSAEIGHPILGCDIYGTGESEHLANRLMLHATTIEFTHPVTGERMLGKSECPF